MWGFVALGGPAGDGYSMHREWHGQSPGELGKIL